MRYSLLALLLLSSLSFALSNLTVNGTPVSLSGNYTYDQVTLLNSGVIYVSAYNGTSGTGELRIYANNIAIGAGSSINGDGRGFRKDEGPGSGGSGTWGASAGGGGYGGNGGSGRVGGSGSAGGGGGAYWTGGVNLSKGSGGGTGALSPWPPEAPGGSGGALIYLEAQSINVSGAITAKGAVGNPGNGGSGGGGSGGGILIKAGAMDISHSTLSAKGGNGGDASNNNAGTGGGGGGGVIKLVRSSNFQNASATIDVSGGVQGGASSYAGSPGSPGVFLYLFSPASPVNLTVIRGVSSLFYSWAAGENTEGFNILFNGAWTNGTSQANMTQAVGAGGWGNISVYGYNSSTGLLSAPSVLNARTLDITPPIISIQSPNATTYFSSLISLNFTVSDDFAVDSCTVLLNGVLNSTACGSYALILADGAYVFNITANDTSGNMNSSAVSFSVLLHFSVYNSTTTDSNGTGTVSLSGLPLGASRLVSSVGSSSRSMPFSSSSGVSSVRISARATLQGSPAPGKSMGFEVS